MGDCQFIVNLFLSTSGTSSFSSFTHEFISNCSPISLSTFNSKDRKEYLHGILQGIGDVERDGFRILGELGASPDRPTIVLSCGGGSKNDVWIAMRERRLNEICDQHVVVKRALNTEASYGAALLAAASFE